jgi:hypothetical protein
MKKRTYGTGSIRKLASGKYQMRYRVPGEMKPRAESVIAANMKQAEKILRDRLNAIEERRLGPKHSMNTLFDFYLRDQRIMQRKQASIVEQKIEKHLRPRFGSIDVYELNPVQIDRYKEDRLRQSAQVRIINHELSILQRTIQSRA